jgi:enterochelin esterase-like enzyme
MDPQDTVTSPRLVRLMEELAEGKPTALDSFWQEIAAGGLPLVEPISGSNQSLVTFLWQAKDEGSKVAIVSNFSGRDGASEPMTRLPGSDIWFKTYSLFNDTRESYQISLDGDNIADPLNPLKHIFPIDEDTGVGGWESSIFELPDAPTEKWNKPLPDVPAGQVTKYRLHSTFLDGEYPVWVYTPFGYSQDAESYGFLVTTDGELYAQVLHTPAILDNLLFAGEIPPLISIMVGGAFSKTRPRDLGCYPPFVKFLIQEVIPWARQNFRLAQDPEKTAIVGVSRGGLMAPYIALCHPEVFGNVIAQSGYFDWKPEGEVEPGWLIRQYAESPRLPLKFHLDAGLYETEVSTVEGPATDILASTRRMRDLLQMKGYPVHYAEFSGGHGPINWPRTLADSLIALFGNLG